MAKFQDFLNRVGSNRDRAALRGIFSQFLTDGDPPALKDLVLASIVLSGAETTQVTISGACTTGILQSGTSTTAYSITGAFTTGISIAADGTTAISITSAFSGTTGISFAGTAADGILISGACTDGLHISGACTNAINITGAVTKAIALAGCTPTLTDADNALISFGTWNDEVDIGTQTAHFVPIQVHMHSTTSAAYDIAAMRLRVDTDGANTLNAVQVGQIRMSISDNCASVAAFGASISVDAAMTLQTGEMVCGGFSIAGAYKPTAAGSNPITVLQACNWNTYAGESVWYIIDAYQNGAGNTVKAVLRGNVIAGTATAGLELINTSGTLTTGISLSGAMTTAINIAKTTAKTAIRIGEWAASQAAGSAVVFATNMAGLDTSQLNIVAAFGESTSDLTGAYSTSVIRGRHLVSAAADTVITHEVYGVMGQVVCKNASFNHYASGVMGTFEASNTLTHVMSGYVAAAVTGRLGGAVLTCESGGLVAGVAAIQHMSAFTATGTIAGFATHKTTTGIAWPIGVYIAAASADIGVSIGACTTAAIDFGLTVGTTAGDGNASLIRGGYAASGGHTAPNAPIVFATANQHALQFYLRSTASQFTGIEMNAYTSAAATGTQWANPCVAGEFTVRSLKADGSVDNMWAILAQAQVLSTNYGPGTGKQMIAGYFKTGNAQGSGGIAGLSTCIYLDTGLNAQSTQGDFMIMAIANNKASTPLSAMAHIAGGMSYVFEFDAIQTEPNGHAWDSTEDKTGGGALGWIKVRVNHAGTYKDKYIQLYGSNA